MLDLLNSINREKVPVPLFLTLTYPDAYPTDPRAWKGHLKAFDKRLVRRWGSVPVIWRMEFQKRGAPHFHLLVFLDVEPSQMYQWLSRSWYEVVGSDDEKHLRAGTQVQRSSSWRGVLSYAAKYMAKPEALAAGVESPGRFWGVRRRDLLPIEMVESEIPVEVAYKIRRHMAKYAGISLKRYANSSTFKAYVPHDVIERLLRYYGNYRP